LDHIIYANGSGSSRVILYLIAVGLDWPDKLTQRLCPLSRLNGHVLAVLSELTITDYAAINLTHTYFYSSQLLFLRHQLPIGIRL
jgi:hypothetical protein